MKIMPVQYNSCGYKNSISRVSERGTKNQCMFKGQTGKIVGTLIGGAAAVGIAVISAPVLVCSAPLLGVVGAIAGDEIQDKINGDNNNE